MRTAIILLHYNLIILLACILTSCEYEIENTKLELLTEREIKQPFLPYDYDMDVWHAYYVLNNSYPMVQGNAISNTVTVRVTDDIDYPLHNVVLYFTADGGKLSEASVATGLNGKASVTWSFDGNWGEWGTFTLTLSAYETDGITHISGSPTYVTCLIEKPAGM